MDERSDQDKFEHSSIFLEKHLFSASYLESDIEWAATVSSTLMLETEDKLLYMFERIYDHSSSRFRTTAEEGFLENLLFSNCEFCNAHTFIGKTHN
jgi:hypothetical protein